MYHDIDVIHAAFYRNYVHVRLLVLLRHSYAYIPVHRLPKTYQGSIFQAEWYACTLYMPIDHYSLFTHSSISLRALLPIRWYAFTL